MIEFNSKDIDSAIVGNHRCVDTDTTRMNFWTMKLRAMGVLHDYVKQGVFKAVKRR